MGLGRPTWGGHPYFLALDTPNIVRYLWAMASRDTTERRRIRSRELILSAARELVLEVGPDKVSLRKIAERAGYSPSSLYEYFDGKDALLRALSQRVAERLSRRLATVPQSLPAPRRLVRYGQEYVRFARALPEDFLLLFLHLRSQRTAHAQPVEAASPYRPILLAAQEGLATGAFNAAAGDAETLAYGLWAVVHGLAMLQLTHLKGYEVDFEVADSAVIESYVAGLTRRT